MEFNTSDKYGYGNQAGIRTTPGFLYSFDPQDSRRLVSVAVAQYDNNGVQQIITDAAALNIGKWNRKWMTSEYIVRMQSATGKMVTGINWVPLRMSNIYLMLAEVENALPGRDIGVAREVLRVVRNRAFSEADQSTRTRLVDNYVNALSKGDDFHEAIMQERAWEFAGESIRKWDLIRWNKLTEKIQEARKVNEQIIKKEGEYDYIPDYLFVKWSASDAVEIDYDQLNLDEDLGTTDISGYTRVSWYSATYSDEEDAAEYVQHLNAWGCGLDGGNGFKSISVQDRHLLPLPQTAIDSSAGTLVNDYGF
ncbi:MAG: RagB/SusD family nutrient uptake outer membrane protein [Bacteroides sp.]|nr:RagB/SusD family nutrient uptake outer membrane protein [Bacteroides sp.]